MTPIELSKAGPWGLANRFKDDWITSRQAGGVFFVCVLFVLGLSPPVLGRVDINGMEFGIRLVLTPVVMIGVAAVLFLWLGMWRYWSRLDGSSKWSKRASFLLLLVGFWYGSAIYYFLVYVPQVIRGRTTDT